MDFNLFKTELAKNKVYSAWPYVLGLLEKMKMMSLSKDLAEKIYTHREETINKCNEELLQRAKENPGEHIPISLEEPTQEIANIKIGDALLMQKSVIEFFHYARVSSDIVLQIVNAALLGDDAINQRDTKLLSKLIDTLNRTTDFTNLATLLTTMKADSNIEYMREFDNYSKHINGIPFTIKGSFFIGEQKGFAINEFYYKEKKYNATDATTIMNTVETTVKDYIDKILTETLAQLPNAQGTTARYQDISFKCQVKRHEGKNYLEYAIYFLEVENGITDLPTELSILPLLIDSDGEIKYQTLDIDKIFITIKGKEEDGICGVAEEKPEQDATLMYRKYTVKPATRDDFWDYFENFKTNYPDKYFSFKAMEGKIITY